MITMRRCSGCIFRSRHAAGCIQALLFVPKAWNLEVMGMGRTDSEVNLYCRKVLIKAKAKGLFPEWLRFLKGVVDGEGSAAEHLPRDDAGHVADAKKLNKVLTTRFLKFLDEQSAKDAPACEKFYTEYQRFLKEGVVTDFTHKEALGKLLRYESSTLAASRKAYFAGGLCLADAAGPERRFIVS